MQDSSKNSWDSWFIFNLRKNKHLLLCEQFRRTYIHRERKNQETDCGLVTGRCITMYPLCFRTHQFDWYMKIRMVLAASFSLNLHITWAMYLLGLSPSWGTSRMCPAWSLSEHQLTPALSPIWAPRPKQRRPEEVVYIPNDSCSHFTQRLFPPKLPQQHTCTTSIIH